MKRKRPVRHPVKSHTRAGSSVKSYHRGAGKKSQRLRKVVSVKSPGRRLYEAQNLWLEHYAFGRPEGDPDRYQHRLDNRERSRVQEHAMDAVREMRKDDWATGWGYIEEKLGRVHDNYLGLYDENPVDWRIFTKLTRNDREILSRFVELEREKVRPLYKGIGDEVKRDAIVTTMDFVVLVASPAVTLDELWDQYHLVRRKVNALRRKHGKGIGVPNHHHSAGLKKIRLRRKTPTYV